MTPLEIHNSEKTKILKGLEKAFENLIAFKKAKKKQISYFTK